MSPYIQKKNTRKAREWSHVSLSVINNSNWSTLNMCTTAKPHCNYDILPCLSHTWQPSLRIDLNFTFLCSIYFVINNNSLSSPSTIVFLSFYQGFNRQFQDEKANILLLIFFQGLDSDLSVISRDQKICLTIKLTSFMMI